MLKIAVTDCFSYENYRKWLCGLAGHVKCVKLSYRLKNLEQIEDCRGLLLTGGGDVHPKFYSPLHQEMELLSGVDEQRDHFEFEAIKKAISLKLPLLGICRGLQIANVFFCGTLIKDLKDKNEVHRRYGCIDKRHRITIKNESFLNKISGVTVGEVNSSHHQAAERVGNSLIVSATSEDGVVEALELKERACSDFFLLVQWHPERMDIENPLSGNIGLSFLSFADGREAKF